MTYRGRVQGGVVILDDPKGLVEGTEVQVERLNAPRPPSWADVLKDVIDAARWPADGFVAKS